MIRVTIELLPSGEEAQKRVLGVAEITNDRQQAVRTRGAMGSYTYRLSKWEPKLDETWKRGRIDGFDRLRRGGWDLLFCVLRDAVGGRNR